MKESTRREFVARAALATGGLAAAVRESSGAHAQAAPAPESKTARLRELLDSPGVTVVPEASCVYAARLAEMSGFPAVYVGGNLIAGMYLGIEDWGLVDLTELVEFGGRIARGVSVPRSSMRTRVARRPSTSTAPSVRTSAPAFRASISKTRRTPSIAAGARAS